MNDEEQQKDPTTYTFRFVEPERSEWKCYLFGGNEYGLVWQPLKGQEPCAWHRFWQRVFFGHRWVKR